jgi:NHLM bacteriocin system ABC transporter peptidase/ATP-binding protein
MGNARPPTAQRRRTPTVLQMEAVECGAAALASVLAYHGRQVPLEELRERCGVSRDGCKAAHLLKAARGYGLDAKGWRAEPADLKALPFPLIVHWEFNHFVVVEGYSATQWYLNDPATGARTVSVAEFDRAFTGLALRLERGPKFVPGGAVPRLLPALWARTVGVRQSVLYVLLIGLALVLPGLVVPAFTKIFVDHLLIAGHENWLRPLLAGMALTVVLRATLVGLEHAALARLEATVAVQSTSRFMAHLFRLPLTFFSLRYPTEVAGRYALHFALSRLLTGSLPTNALNVVVGGFYALLLLAYDVWLASGVLAVGLLNGLALRWAARALREANHRCLATEGRLIGTALNGVQGIGTLKASGTETAWATRLAGMRAPAVLARQQLAVLSQAVSVVPGVLGGLTTAFILGLGGWRVMTGALTLGELVAFQALASLFLQPLGELVQLGSQLEETHGTLTRIDDVLRYPAEPANPAPDTGARLSGQLDVVQVSFGYSRLEPPLLRDVTLSVQPGQCVAVVGGSGSGKSTLARLVTGLYTPWTGEVRYAGQQRSAWPRAVLARSVALVDQDIVLFAGSVRDNLTLWDTTIPEPAMSAAARTAGIHSVIVGRPGGYEAPVLEAGRNFSGGERQRLELARALAGQPSLLVLDEATSALDTETEHAILTRLRADGAACLLIAHRLSTVRDCDAIIVLDAGQVVERGTHAELLAHDGVYARLIRAEEGERMRDEG